MSDPAIVATAVLACLAAVAAVPLPWAAGVVLALVARLWRSPAALAVGVVWTVSGLSALAHEGLRAPATGEVAGWATLVDDPSPALGAVRARVRLDGRHLEAWARGEPAAALRPRLAGERVLLRGRLRPLSGRVAPHLEARHVVARLEVTHAGGDAPGSVASRIANRVRRSLDRGARSLDDAQRSLLLGLTVGDDRGQPPELRDAFRASGLSHLLAVSGQNVALVVALAGPLLRRLGLHARWAVVVGVLVLYAVVTRWEPSVLRASAMAAVTVTAATLGRPGTALRTVALGVTASVVVDPLVVRTVGFQLSVGATAGIAVLAGPLTARLRAARWLAAPLAVTIAAQVGVAPVAIPVFGSIPLASLPANVLAGPAAGPLTAWGLTAGAVAGHVPETAAAVLHGPTRLLTGWLEVVASRCAALPLGSLGAGASLGLLAGTALLASARWAWRRWS